MARSKTEKMVVCEIKLAALVNNIDYLIGKTEKILNNIYKNKVSKFLFQNFDVNCKKSFDKISFCNLPMEPI